MLIAFFDFETTGTDVSQDRVTEVGALLYTTTHKRVVMAEQVLVDSGQPISPKIKELTKINKPMCDKFGLIPADALARLQNYFDMAEAIGGNNIVEFDLPLYRNWCLQEKEEPIERLAIDIKKIGRAHV